jgi:dihydroneopterin aldolase
VDTVFIQGLTVDALIGCYEWEKDKRQKIRFDIEMAWDIRKAGASDALAETLDYNAVATRVTQFAEENQFELVEALAENVASIITEEFAVPGLRLRLSKLEAIENTIDVGVKISRGVEF